MATLRKEIPVAGAASPVWQALRDFGQVHTKVAPGFLTDLKMADLDGLAILRKARAEMPDAEVVMITGFGDVKTAEKAAFDHDRLALVHLREFAERAVEREQIFAARGRFLFGGVEGYTAKGILFQLMAGFCAHGLPF